jgi:hypothetical protein
MNPPRRVCRRSKFPPRRCSNMDCRGHRDLALTPQAVAVDTMLIARFAFDHSLAGAECCSAVHCAAVPRFATYTHLR